MTKTNKTYKREVALFVLGWMVYLSLYGLEALKIIVMPAFAFMGLAFGLDWWGKDGGEAARKFASTQEQEE